MYDTFVLINHKYRILRRADKVPEGNVTSYINFSNGRFLSKTSQAVWECCNGIMPDIHYSTIEQILAHYVHDLKGDSEYTPMTLKNCRIDSALVSIHPILSGCHENRKRYIFCLDASCGNKIILSGPESEVYEVCVTVDGENDNVRELSRC